MDLKEAAAVAKKHIADAFAADPPQNVRLEEFFYDDHLGFWSLTIGFALGSAPETRNYKIIRVMEADKSVLSMKDR